MQGFKSDAEHLCRHGPIGRISGSSRAMPSTKAKTRSGHSIIAIGKSLRLTNAFGGTIFPLALVWTQRRQPSRHYGVVRRVLRLRCDVLVPSAQVQTLAPQLFLLQHLLPQWGCVARNPFSSVKGGHGSKLEHVRRACGAQSAELRQTPRH